MNHIAAELNLATPTLSDTMSPLSREPTSTRTSVNLVKSEPLLDDKPLFIIQKNVAFVGEQGGNGAAATYQHVTGAPVETHSPLGYHVGFWTAVGLNVTMLIGTGIFSTRELLSSNLLLY